MIRIRWYCCVTQVFLIPMAGMASPTEEARKHYEQGVVALQNQAFDQAIAEFTAVIRLDPKHTDAYYGRASCYASKEEDEKAAVDYSKIITINPRDTAAYGGRGAAYYDMGEDDKALADFNKAIQLNPKDNHIYYNRALLHARRNDHDKAIADFSEAIRLDPNDNRSYYCRANSFIVKGNHRRAITDFNEAIRLDPWMMIAYSNRGIAYWELGEYKKALSDYGQAIRLDPHSPLLYKNRAWLLAVSPVAGIRDGQKALKDARKACQLTDWQDVGCLVALAAAYAEVRDFEAAVKWQKRAVELTKKFSTEQRIGSQELLKLYEQGKPYREKVGKAHDRGEKKTKSEKTLIGEELPPPSR